MYYIIIITPVAQMCQNICSDGVLNSESHSKFSFYDVPVWIIGQKKGNEYLTFYMTWT